MLYNWPFYDPLRECNYLYHRQGIDHLYDKKVEAKKQMFEALNKLSPIVLTRPNNVSILNFLSSKISEFKNKIYITTGIPPFRQHLWYEINGKTIQNI